MTREEALAELIQFSGTTELKLSANFWTALGMSIKALEQEVKMRDATPEERESVDKYIKSISTTGVDFYDLESCEDAVSRQAVVELIEGWWLGHTKEDDLATEVRALPPVIPTHTETVTEFADKCRECGKQQKSEWVVSFHGYPPEPTTTCKKCGFDRDFNIKPRYFEKIKYCPNCGAEMESEE